MDIDRQYTLVLGRDEAGWTEAAGSGHSIIHVDSLPLLRQILLAANSEFGREIARVVLDQTVAPADFLRLLATLPSDFLGDVLLLEEGGEGFLSSPARGDGRVLYQLLPEDVSLYRAVHLCEEEDGDPPFAATHPVALSA